MSGISAYLLSIAGIVILTTLFDLILSENKISKYIKSIMALVLIFVIVSPLPKLFKSGLNLNSFLEDSIKLNTNYNNVFNDEQIKVLEQNLSQKLKEEGFDCVKITIWADFDQNNIKINYIFVDLENLVLRQNDQHININEAIKILLMEQTGIDEERVVFND